MRRRSYYMGTRRSYYMGSWKSYYLVTRSYDEEEEKLLHGDEEEWGPGGVTT